MSRPLPLPQIVAAGAFSGVITPIVTAPSERVKILLQVQGQAGSNGQGPAFQGSHDCVQYLWKAGGLRCVYKGFLATVMRDSFGYATYFLVYEASKRFLTTTTIAVTPETTPSGSQTPGWRQDTPSGIQQSLVVLFSGGLCGSACWIVCSPFDVIKSRIQAETSVGNVRSVRQVANELYRKQGIKAFFKGVGPSIGRAFPANAACMAGVEFSKYMFSRFGS